MAHFSAAKLSGSPSFSFGNAWLTKGAPERARDTAVFRRNDAMIALGIGKNIVDSTKRWSPATKIWGMHHNAKNNRSRLP